MIEEIIELKGASNGPTSVILVGVHGNEKCGVFALQKILQTLNIEFGRVLFAYGNPRAIDQNVRFTEMNLNRAFKPNGLYTEQEKNTYEYQRAQFLKNYLNQADALLDVHASFTPDSKRFIICENNSEKIAQYLPFNLVSSGFDKLEPGGTDGYMNSQNKIGICVECGYLGDSSSTQVAEEAILNFLSARHHINRQIKKYPQTKIKFNSIYFTKTNNFRLNKDFIDFEEIKKGELIGSDSNEEIRALEDSVIIFARNRNTVGDEAFLLGNYYI